MVLFATASVLIEKKQMHTSNSEQHLQRLTLISSWLKKHQHGSLTSEEYTQLQEWFSEDPVFRKAWVSGLQDLKRQQKDLQVFHHFASNNRLEKVLHHVPRINERPARLSWYRYMRHIAAALFLFLSIGVIFWQLRDGASNGLGNLSERRPALLDKGPGKNQAYLTLADGTVLQLDTAQSGILVTDHLQYPDGRTIVENPVFGGDGTEAHRELALTTPKGGQYQVTLEDGTKVWLNAGSTLRYPRSFTETDRVVHLDGEAYFEVKQMKQKPFIVVSGRQRVEVLGTSFNINAYSTEKMRTTLLTGKVRLHRDTESEDLLPGQQGVIIKNGPIYVHQAIVEDVVAWKEGYFMFNNEPLEEVMAKVGQWYDLDIEFMSPKLKSEKVFGTISRSENLGQVLNMLEKVDVAVFETEPGRIRVYPTPSK